MARLAEPGSRVDHRPYSPRARCPGPFVDRGTRLGAEGRHRGCRTLVMEIVGHAALEMTMNVYGHIALDDQRAALDRL